MNKINVDSAILEKNFLIINKVLAQSFSFFFVIFLWMKFQNHRYPPSLNAVSFFFFLLFLFIIF